MHQVIVLILLAVPLHAKSGNQLRIQAPGFTLLISEPSGWTIDVRSASQIAHFVVHPVGTDWRQAESFVMARFLGRKPGEKVEDFFTQEIESLRQRCPHSAISDVDLKDEMHHDFVAKAYDCKGSRYEIVAVAVVPRFYAVLILSSKDEVSAAAAHPAFQELLASFYWQAEPHPEAHDNRNH